MGSCFSKCTPKNSHLREVKEEEEEDGEHVKQAISPAEKPVSPSPSSASLSSSSASNSNSNSSYSLTSSLSSSKDGSFSNEFLRSCAKENQHVIVMKPSKEGNLERASSLRHRRHQNPLLFLSSTNAAMPSLKPWSPRMQQQIGGSGSTPKKRPRSNSPTLTLVRQKSFRKDPQISVNTTTSTCHFPNTALSSPSPTRRFMFSPDGRGKMDISPFRHRRAFNATVGKHNSKPASPNCHCQPRGVHSGSKGNIVNSMRDGEVQSNQEEMDTMLIDDINNPLIALDCFIFL